MSGRRREVLIMEYPYSSSEAGCTAPYLWPVLERLLTEVQPAPARVLDLGCGNGATAILLHDQGYSVTGIDTSISGISIARRACPNCRFEVASVYDEDLVDRLGDFDAIISLEVIEHCPDSFGFMEATRSLLRPGGVAIVSTPYHSYLKNLLVVLAGRFDRHFDPLWRGGHLKFFSISKLRDLICATGLEPVRFVKAGRIPPIAKSVVAIARRS